ncbi:MAG: single-stranded DNA-binding protein [Bacteroidales bacterium]|nr:single-stranded DNA-binding protein [Candidatus Scybalousia scybalohippi]
MNKVQLVGRLVRDAEVRYTSGDSPMAIARWTVACDRRIKKDGEQNADFIQCIAFGKTAEFIERYFFKGNKIGIVGRIQTGSYENKDGQKVYTTEVLAEEVEFVESKNNSASNDSAKKNDSFMNIPDQIAEELPFN